MGLAAAEEDEGENLFAWFKGRLEACRPEGCRIGAFEQNPFVVDYLRHLKLAIEAREALLREELYFFKAETGHLTERKPLIYPRLLARLQYSHSAKDQGGGKCSGWGRARSRDRGGTTVGAAVRGP